MSTGHEGRARGHLSLVRDAAAAHDDDHRGVDPDHPGEPVELPESIVHSRNIVDTIAGLRDRVTEIAVIVEIDGETSMYVGGYSPMETLWVAEKLRAWALEQAE